MSAIETFTPSALNVTAGAVAKVQSLRDEEDNPQLMLRVYVTGGGCSGFQYKFDFDTEKQPDDLELRQHGVAVLVDDMSLGFLGDAQLDYVEELVGSYFKVENPNATASCGCGTSFSI